MERNIIIVFVAVDGDLLTRASEDITDIFPHLSFFQARWLLIVTWHNVTFYGSTNATLVKRLTCTCGGVILVSKHVCFRQNTSTFVCFSLSAKRHYDVSVFLSATGSFALAHTSSHTSDRLFCALHILSR